MRRAGVLFLISSRRASVKRSSVKNTPYTRRASTVMSFGRMRVTVPSVTALGRSSLEFINPVGLRSSYAWSRERITTTPIVATVSRPATDCIIFSTSVENCPTSRGSGGLQFELTYSNLRSFSPPAMGHGGCTNSGVGGRQVPRTSWRAEVLRLPIGPVARRPRRNRTRAKHHVSRVDGPCATGRLS